MTKEEFIESFADCSKISLMNTILSDIYDKTQENINNPTHIIKSHIDGIVEEASHDSRLIDVFLNDRLHNLKCKLNILQNRSGLEGLRALFLEETLKTKIHCEQNCKEP